MKLLEYIKIFVKPHIKSANWVEYRLIINEIQIPKIKILKGKFHSYCYKILRTFVIPQYDTVYLLRGKKAFNTILFRKNYDVVISDKNGKILKTFIDLAPGFISNYYKDGYSVFFMTVGSIKYYDIKKTDRFQLSRIILK